MRMLRSFALAGFCLGLTALASSALAADKPAGPSPEATPAFLERGEVVYVKRCSFCHGLLGDGEGPAAEFLDPRPRDFTLGTFKIRTTQSGELPTDEDLFRTISRGLPGTGMQAFDDGVIKNGLSEEERWAVIAYIKTFAFEFEDPELDPVSTGKVVALPAERAPFNAETIARGKEIFDRAKCWECHGKLGRGDGQKAFDREDDWGFPIRIRNVTLPWKIKGGTEVEDIYMRFSTGINGTPMPSFVKALDENERWDLANYIKSLQRQPTEGQVLRALAVSGELPESADDPVWAEAPPLDIRLAGQVVAAPRWQNPSIELATLRAAYNETDIAFLIQWDDPFADVTHDSAQEVDIAALRQVGAYGSYVPLQGLVPRQLETYRDSIALQFPVKAPEGTRKPHFLRGSSSDPVHLWVWKSDRAEQGVRSVEEATARGWQQPPTPQAEDRQQIEATAAWDQGQWSVVMRRPLQTEDRGDVQFVKGQFIPLVVNAWDGSNGEHGIIMSVSSWHFVLLEAGTPVTVYIYAILAILISGALGYWLMRWAQRGKVQGAV